MIKGPQQALKHLAQQAKTRKDKIALDIIIDSFNSLIEHEHFAKLYLHLFAHGILAYGDTRHTHELIIDILKQDTHTLTKKVVEAYNDIQVLKVCDENLISTDHLNPGGEENFALMSDEDKNKIIKGVDFDVIAEKMKQLINSSRNV